MIVTEAVRDYLEAARREPDPLLAEMEARGAREGIPIVVPQTGQLLQVLALARGVRRIVEVGTAIGVSTLYLARAVPPDGTVVTFEIDPERQAAAREYLRRAGLEQRVDLRLEDARSGLAALEGLFDLAFVDGSKTEYGDYLELLLPLLGERSVLVVDNVLMGGTVAESRSDGLWSEQQIAAARTLNRRLVEDERLTATVTPVGDGVLIAVRNPEGAG
jgi:caffeoyl-CoA O-methyltransferase